jgi:hypothetical protein
VDLQRPTIGTVPLRALPMTAALGLEVRSTPEGSKVPQRVVAHEYDITAPAAVAAVGSALRHMGLATEAETTIAAAPGLNVNTSSILQAMTSVGSSIRASQRVAPSSA